MNIAFIWYKFTEKEQTKIINKSEIICMALKYVLIFLHSMSILVSDSDRNEAIKTLMMIGWIKTTMYATRVAKRRYI